MSCGGGMGRSGSGSCPPACCPPVVIKTGQKAQEGQCVVFQLPPVNIVCEIPPQPKKQKEPKVCCVPIVVCEDDEGCCPTEPPAKIGRC